MQIVLCKIESRLVYNSIGDDTHVQDDCGDTVDFRVCVSLFVLFCFEYRMKNISNSMSNISNSMSYNFMNFL